VLEDQFAGRDQMERPDLWVGDAELDEKGEWLLSLFRDGYHRLPGTPAVPHGTLDTPCIEVHSDLL
jgi:hypothetical protein